MRRRLVQRVDRRYQNPKPGKLKRVKWPRKLVDVLDVNLQVGQHLQAPFAKHLALRQSKSLGFPCLTLSICHQVVNQNDRRGSYATQRWQSCAVSPRRAVSGSSKTPHALRLHNLQQH